MADDALWSLGATEIVQGIKTGQFSSQEVVQASIERVTQTNDAVNAITEIRPEEALAAAKQADQQVARGEALGPLHGLPTVIKANVDVGGWATVNGCSALLGNVAPNPRPACKTGWTPGRLCWPGQIPPSSAVVGKPTTRYLGKL